MLDYAQLSAGRFRKFLRRFDLIKSINETVGIMKFKANELGIKININLAELFQTEYTIKQSLLINL